MSLCESDVTLIIIYCRQMEQEIEVCSSDFQWLMGPETCLNEMTYSLDQIATSKIGWRHYKD